MKSSSCALVVWFLCVLSVGRAQFNEGESCAMDDGTQGVCTSFLACPGAIVQIATGKTPKRCMFVKNDLPIVCCNSGVTTTIIAPEVLPRADFGPRTSTTTTTPTVDVNVARRKCGEYASHVFRIVKEPSMLLHQPPVIKNSSECFMAAETLIVGGVAAAPNEFPHMAALGYGATESDAKWQCGGSLISERFVLTAAHCRQSREFGFVRWVRLGDLNLYKSDDNVEPVTIPVLEFIKHEGYKPPAQYNDIALLKLDRDVTFSPYIRPACLNTVPGNPQRKRKVTASGWGKLVWSEESGSENLMKVDLEIQDESSCTQTFLSLIGKMRLKKGITSESMICAGDPKGKKDTCGGDSGGPLQIRLTSPDPFCMYSVVGLVSFGPAVCGSGNSSAVYTRVSHYIPWIVQHVWP